MTAVTDPTRSRGGRTASVPPRQLAHRPLERSPIHLFTLLAGLCLAVIGWGVATLLDRSAAALSADLIDAFTALPPWTAGVSEVVAAGGTIAALVAVPAWLVQRRRLRDLLLAVLAVLAAVALSLAVAEAVRAVARPEVQAAFDGRPAGSARWLATDPSVAAVIAVLALIRRSLPPRVRRTVYASLPVWLLAQLASLASPYLGMVLDVALGLVAGSAVALLLRTPSHRPTAQAIIDGLAAVGIDVVQMTPAAVDARGSVPWFASTATGQRLFVKALSREQRLADLMFRLLRWLRLRRTGDPPPETSLRRAAEHEAFLAAHVHRLGVPTPTALTVADIGDENVALVYEAVEGRSLDQVAVTDITDDVLRQAWTHVRQLRRHGVAHRDLRLANLFLAGDRLLLIDFGFAELSASRQLQDVDVAELLTATACQVGVARAVAMALEVLGRGPVASAEEWVHPLLLSHETGHAAARRQLLSPLRSEIRHLTGVARVEHEPPGRLHPQRLIGPTATIVTILVLLTVLLGVEGRTNGIVEPGLAAAAVLVAACWYPAVAMAHRAATHGRVPFRSSLRAVLRSRLPVAASTYWAQAVRLLSEVPPEGALGRSAARRAASRWAEAGITVAPILAGVFALAAARKPLGYLLGVVVAVATAAALTAVQVALRSGTRWGKQLAKVWLLRDEAAAPISGSIATAIWWSAAVTSHAVAVALAVRSVGITTPTETVMALAVVVTAVSWLVASRSGCGVVEGLLLVGLWVGSDLALSALAVVVASVATYWVHVPVMLVGQALAGRASRASP